MFNFYKKSFNCPKKLEERIEYLSCSYITSHTDIIIKAIQEFSDRHDKKVRRSNGKLESFEEFEKSKSDKYKYKNIIKLNEE